MAVKTEMITESVEPLKAADNLGDTQEEEDKDTASNLSSDAISVDSTTPAKAKAEATAVKVSKWKKPFEPAPIVDQSTILIIGFLIFGLAVLWPPLILLVAYVVSKLVPYSFRVNDDATQRRQLLQEFTGDIEATPEAFRVIPENMHFEQEYWVNSRGMCLNTYVMVPKHRPVLAVVCFCHGYTDNMCFMKRVEKQRLVRAGIAFVTLEYEGHGKSDGPLGLINDWEKLVDDVASFYQEVALKRFHGKPVFLVGESMGGAVAYSTYNRIPSIFRGVVFIAPMCKISDKMLPSQWVIDVLKWMIGPRGTTSFLGYLPIAPAKGDLKDMSHKVAEKRNLLARCPTVFARNPRLATARELIDVTQHISDSLKEFDAPFLVVHGKEDRVTDPNLSQALYEESKSKDKTIHLYEGMWHALTTGEPDENIDRVFNDCIKWILERS